MRYVLIALAALFWLTGCGSNPTVKNRPETWDVSEASEYQIGIGDQLQIGVWKNPELSVSVPVRPDGKISVPLAGDVLAAGKTPQDLSSELTSTLEQYIRSPKVTVIVTNPASADFLRRIRITGAVNHPQSVPYRKGMTVLDLVLQAGGLTPFAVADDAKLYRKTSKGLKSYPIYLGDILEKGRVDTNYTLMPSDIITVPERAF